jgi:hypothetical protein
VENWASSNILVYPTRCNVIQFVYIWKLFYMFRVVLPPIIRSACNYIYSIWYLSRRYCYLPLSWKSWNRFEGVVGGVRHPQHTQTVWRCILLDILTMHLSIKVKSPNNISKWHMGFNSAFKGLNMLQGMNSDRRNKRETNQPLSQSVGKTLNSELTPHSI